MKNRCGWVTDDPLYLEYHDKEWGVPVHDDSILFEFLILEGAQAGLSWITILKKRGNYREAFDNFNPAEIAKYNPNKINRLLLNPGIIRNRLKIESAVKNAKAFLEIQKKFNSFYDFFCHFVYYIPIIISWLYYFIFLTPSPESIQFISSLYFLAFSFI